MFSLLILLYRFLREQTYAKNDFCVQSVVSGLKMTVENDQNNISKLVNWAEACKSGALMSNSANPQKSLARYKIV